MGSRFLGFQPLRLASLTRTTYKFCPDLSSSTLYTQVSIWNFLSSVVVTRELRPVSHDPFHCRLTFETFDKNLWFAKPRKKKKKKQKDRKRVSQALEQHEANCNSTPRRFFPGIDRGEENTPLRIPFFSRKILHRRRKSSRRRIRVELLPSRFARRKQTTRK